jgi:hypothetical protein
MAVADTPRRGSAIHRHDGQADRAVRPLVGRIGRWQPDQLAEESVQDVLSLRTGQWGKLVISGLPFQSEMSM